MSWSSFGGNRLKISVPGSQIFLFSIFLSWGVVVQFIGLTKYIAFTIKIKKNQDQHFWSCNKLT